MQNVVKRISINFILFVIFICVSCNNNREIGMGFPTVYDVTVDKTVVSVGDEMTVSYYISKGSSDLMDKWDKYTIEQNTHTLVYKDSTNDYTTSFVYFIDGIDENDMKQHIWKDHVRYLIPYPYGNSEYTEKDVTKITEYTYYHFDEETRTVMLKFNVPVGLKSGYLKIHYQADYAAGFYPHKITVLEN